MPSQPMDNSTIRAALQTLAEELDYASPVEITMAGGAALMLTGSCGPIG